jgi:hypothetical protein
MADVPLDFFTTLHNAIWDLLEASDTFKGIFDVRNRVKMTADDFETFPPNVDESGTPELAIIQGGFTQNSFKFGDPAVQRTQTFTTIITSGKLSPIQINKGKEAMMDALLLKGQTLGLTQPVNGNKVVGWSLAGDDMILAGAAETPGENRVGQLRSQSIGRVTVTFMKSLQRTTI